MDQNTDSKNNVEPEQQHHKNSDQHKTTSTRANNNNNDIGMNTTRAHNQGVTSMFSYFTFCVLLVSN